MSRPTPASGGKSWRADGPHDVLEDFLIVEPTVEPTVRLFPNHQALGLIVAALAASACGVGGGGGQQVAAPPTLAVDFPPAHVITDGTSVTVRGTTTFPTRIRDVRVDAVPAATSDGFATWSASAPLAQGFNAVTVAADRAGGGALAPVDLQVDVTTLLLGPQQIAFASQRNMLLVVDDRLLELVGFDLVERRFETISGARRGAGPALDRFPTGVAVDAGLDEAYVLANFPARVLSVDLATGDRATVSDASSAGVAFGSPRDVDLDLARGRLLVADTGLNAILAVDVATGARSILSDATHGSGPLLTSPNFVDVVAARGIALVGDGLFPQDVLAVDLATGDRTLVTGSGRGSGPAIVLPSAAAFDSVTGDALVVDAGTRALFRVDLVTGDREVVSDPATGGGAELLSMGDVAVVDAAARVAVVLDSEAHTLDSVDLASGARVDLDGVRLGNGRRLPVTTDAVVDPARGRVVAVVDLVGPDALWTIDTRSGDRLELSGPNSGSGPDLDSVKGVDLDDGGGRAIVATENGTVFSVDLQSGARSILSDATTGSGVRFGRLEAVAVDDARGVALVVDTAPKSGGTCAVLSLDLATGVRALVSGDSRGSGPTLGSAEDLTLDASHDLAYLMDRDVEAILRVDLVTGNRAIVMSLLPDLIFPEALALEADGAHLLLLDFTAGLFRVDVATGGRQLLSGPALGSGPALERGLTLDPGGTAAFAATLASGFAKVDLVNGDRVLFSK